MWNTARYVLLAVLGIASLVACSGIARPMPSVGVPVKIPHAIGELAGSWEYQDVNGTFPLVLNEQGHGPYDWKEGRFETIALKNGVWTGKWYQAENDREGEFELTFSEDIPWRKVNGGIPGLVPIRHLWSQGTVFIEADFRWGSDGAIIRIRDAVFSS